MKKSLFTLVVLSAAVLCAADSSYNYLKAFFNPYPKDPAITLKSSVNGSSRVLDLSIAAPKPMTSLYTYAKLTPGKKMTFSFLYKLSDYKVGKKAFARMQINFQAEGGKALKGVKPHTAKLALKNTNGKYVKASTTFEVPADTAQAQMVLLYLGQVAGKFQITNVTLVPASDIAPVEVESAYKTNAYWANWPRNNSIKLVRSSDRKTATFSSASPGDNAALYTYLKLHKFVTYSINFTITSEELIQTPGGSASISLDFQNKAGKPSGDAAMNWKLDLPVL